MQITDSNGNIITIILSNKRNGPKNTDFAWADLILSRDDIGIEESASVCINPNDDLSNEFVVIERANNLFSDGLYWAACETYDDYYEYWGDVVDLPHEAYENYKDINERFTKAGVGFDDIGDLIIDTYCELEGA